MYKIKSIALHKFEGLSLAFIKSFKIEEINDFLIILGRNGSGKSKILGTFFPIAPAKKHFEPGGYYENISELNGDTIRFHVKRVGDSLKCSITNVTKSLEVCKDVNPKVYNSHVEELTGLTPAIVKLLTGREHFTKMSSLARKAWLDKFSSNDLTYALGFFNRTKEKLRDTSGVLKHLNTSLSNATEESNTSKDERDELKARLEEVQTKLESVNVDISRFEKPAEYVSLDALNRHFETLAEHADGFIHSSTGDSLSELNTQTLTLETLYGWLGENNEAMSVLSTEIERYRDELQKNEYYLQNRGPLEAKRNRYNEEIKEVTSTFNKYPDFAELDEVELNRAHRTLTDDYIRIDRISDVLNPVEGLRSLRSKVERLGNDVNEIRVLISKAEFNIRETTHTLDHYTSTETVECERCKHTFKPGLSGVRPERLEKDIQEYAKNKGLLEEKLVEAERVFAEERDQLSNLETLQEWLSSISTSVVLSLVVKDIVTSRVIQQSPRQLHIYLKNAIADVLTALKVKKLVVQRNKVNDELSVLANTDGTSSEIINQKLLTLEEQYIEKQKKEKKLNEEINITKKRIHDIQNAINSKTAFLGKVQDTDTLMSNYFDTAISEELDTQRRLLSDQWIGLRERYLKMEEVVNRVRSIKADIEMVTAQQTALKEMVDCLSPEKGILKKYYYNTVVRVIDLMNDNLESMWDYPLAIQACPLTNGALSYDFPYVFGSDLKEVEDVREGSEAQQQVFDLVFVLMAYKALNLVGYPLFLDEPGTGFDEQHRAAFVNFVRTLIDTKEHSQLVMISHYADVHSRLNRADFVVVDPEGLTVPTVYNTHVTIDYYGD